MPSKFQKVYVVTGSKDGNLGVFGNFKAAYDRAVSYLTQNDDGTIVTTSYAQALKRKNCSTIGCDSDYSTAMIELFYFNSN